MMDFIAFARAHGVEIAPGRFFAGDRIRRCGTTDKPKSSNGAYFFDGQRGWVFNWAAEAKVQWWNDASAQPWTEAEKAAWRDKRKAWQATQTAGHERAAHKAAAMLKGAHQAVHDYLIRKGFPATTGLVDAANALLVPMRDDQTNALLGVQVIRWLESERRFEKKMIPGMRAKGAVFRMGHSAAPEVVLCEGYATGLSIAAALRSAGLRSAVLVCFSASNLIHVARRIKARALVFADNDASRTGEQAAIATGLPYCMSDTVGEDANDLHIRAGLMAVTQKLMEARRR